MRSRRKIWSFGIIGICLPVFLFFSIAHLATHGPSAAPAKGTQVVLSLTILHNNDGESQLVNAGSGLENFGGIERFGTVLQGLRKEAEASDAESSSGQYMERAVITIGAGDSFRASPEFAASLKKGPPFSDTISLDLLQYDAMALGNHEFDFGPEVLAAFIEGFQRPVPFVSANMDVSMEPRLQDLAAQGRIVKSSIISKAGGRIGIVGATADNLKTISSPRHVRVYPAGPYVQQEIDRLEQMGVNKIIVVSHLQSINDSLRLAQELRGADIMIAGGGDELLANEGNVLIPGDEKKIFGPYPLWVEGADGTRIPVVSTAGSYKYVGQLVVGFDSEGRLVMVDEDRSMPIRVADGNRPDSALALAGLENKVVKPVREAVAGLGAKVVGRSEIPLNGVREDLRSVETNEGNLIADAILWEAAKLAEEYGAQRPDVAFLNGGGIRNNSVIPPGDITELDTFSILPFSNFVTIVQHVPRGRFKEVLENAVCRVEEKDGRFAQIAGFRMSWDPAGRPQATDDKGNIVQTGRRVMDVILNNGTVIVSTGNVVQGPDLDIATIDFLARGGDQYPYLDSDFITLGVTYQQALANYIRHHLGGIVTAARYPAVGDGRIGRL
jgi:2',3'-cyclic-nucleotide 2'-phosphodiesterase (5'-nucleotidase family)